MRIEQLTHKGEGLRIMYLFPQEIGKGPDAIYTFFLRISNYLNSRKDELPVNIDEIYIDLRFEDLPPFNFQKFENYLKELIILFNKIYYDFPFDLIAISCYSSYEYLNSIVVASLIKSFINPNAKLVVGGYHPSLFPKEFQSDHVPNFIYKYFPKFNNLFDYLIKGEGEITFFKLIEQLLNNGSISGTNENNNCITLEGETIQLLDELPLINLNLLKRYKEKIKGRRLNIDFGRGCMFQCKICIPSNGKELAFHKNVRYKSVDKCIEELRIIKNTKWLKFSSIFISDPIFFPKRSIREEFFEKFRSYIVDKGKSPFTMGVYDRVDICSKKDLLQYKELNINPQIGFESASIPMLRILKKINSKNEEDFRNYIKKLEDLIKFSNEIKSSIRMFLIIGLPGETEGIIKDNQNFFLKKRFNGKSLSEISKIILDVRYYKAFPGATLYNTCEIKFGGKIHYKDWWRLPLADHRVYNKIVDPSGELSFLDSLRLNYNWIKEFIRHQINNKTPYYDKGDFKILREGHFKYTYIYKNRKADYYSFIPESWKKGNIFP